MEALGRGGVARSALLRIGFTGLAALPVTALGRDRLGTEDGDWS